METTSKTLGKNCEIHVMDWDKQDFKFQKHTFGKSVHTFRHAMSFKQFV
jgi:hypothetical protein